MHCKDISVRSVNVELTKENISQLMGDWSAYKRAEHLVLEHNGEYAVLRIGKTMGPGLFGKVTEYEIVSLPSETVFIQRPEADVLNVPTLARIQSEFPGKAVVVKGLFSHISFVKDLEPLKLRVLDSVPPYPSKMAYLSKIALASGYIELPVITDEVVLDFAEESKKAETSMVMFPCEGSGTKGDRPYVFLDQVPDISGKDITLVGCNLSKRIFDELYHSDIPFINVCPKDHVPDDGVKTIVKCCRVKKGHQIEGNVVMVPWGATVPEVVGAINAVFSQ